MGPLKRWILWRFAARNTLEGYPVSISGKLKIKSPGGNRIEIGAGVSLRNVSISFAGSGNTIRFADGSSPCGRFAANNGGLIEIGAHTRFNKACWMQAHEGKAIRIGQDCLFADIRIRTSDMHKILDVKTKKRINPAADVTIADHVWIAESVSIYKGVTIGEHTVIGAHAVVTGDIPDHAVAVGCPAKVVRQGITWKR